MTLIDPLPLVSGGLDRDASARLDELALDEAWRDPATRVLRVQPGSKFPVREIDGRCELDLLEPLGDRSEAHSYLGKANGAPVFAMIATHVDGYAEPPNGWAHPFSFATDLDPLGLELLSVASAIVNWHLAMPFSPRDGSETVPVQGGWARHDSLGGEHFPRTDPAVIVLVEHEDRLLLGSNALWEAGRFSLLAGFVEAGESAEQAVVREVFEESGVAVDGVQYIASQPWPFPRSLMLGFRAKLAVGADPAQLNPDPNEISELRWFTRAELANPSLDIRLPQKLSIARWLIELWIAEGDRE